MHTRHAALFAIPAFLFASAASASEPRGPNRLYQPAPSGVSSVSTLLDAASLAHTGRTTSQHELLSAAARVAADVSPTPSVRVKKTESGKSMPAEKPIVLDPARLQEQAMALGGVASKTLPPAKRGTAYYQSERVAPGATDVFEISFKASEPAQVGVAGLGDADVDLRVFDESWNEICAATSDSAREYCSWVPATTGVFRIRVRNQGKTADDYVLVTN
jgi:hypothetical protein